MKRAPLQLVEADVPDGAGVVAVFTRAVNGFITVHRSLLEAVEQLEEVHALRHEEVLGRLARIEAALGIDNDHDEEG